MGAEFSEREKKLVVFIMSVFIDGVLKAYGTTSLIADDVLLS